MSSPVQSPDAERSPPTTARPKAAPKNALSKDSSGTLAQHLPMMTFVLVLPNSSPTKDGELVTNSKRRALGCANPPIANGPQEAESCKLGQSLLDHTCRQ